MFSHKRLIVVAVIVLSAMVFVVPSLGAKKINDEQFVEMCKKGNTQRVIEAINSGANVNATDKYNGLTENVNALIDAGAYVKQRDNDGKMAVDYARDNPKLTGTYTLKRLERLSR